MAIVTVDDVEGRSAPSIVFFALLWRNDEKDIDRKGVEVAVGKGKMFNADWITEVILGIVVK